MINAMLSNIPIRRKLMLMMLLVSATVLIFTCGAFIVVEYQAYRQSMVRYMQTMAQMIAANSTAALAFDNQDDATEVLAALQAETNITNAALYAANGTLFATYPRDLSLHAVRALPASPGADGPRFEGEYFIEVAPVAQDGRRLGTLYIKSDLRALYQRIELYSLVAAAMAGIALLLAYVLSRTLQARISAPVLALADAAQAVAERHDYSIRVTKRGGDEFGLLTDAFNHMLTRIEHQSHEVLEGRELLRAIIDTAVEGIITIDEQGTIEALNPAATHIFGYPRHEVLGRNVKMLMPPHYATHHDQYLLNYLSTGERKIIGSGREVAGMRKDGSQFPMELAVIEVRLSGKRKFSGFVRDITERKQGELRLKEQLARLDLLHRITGAAAARQDLHSIFEVVLRSLEDNMPIQFGCLCLYNSESRQLIVTSFGAASAVHAARMAMHVRDSLPVNENGLARCVGGELVYEPDVAAVPSAFPRRLADAGLHALVAAPLLVENKVFGVLLAARTTSHSFSSSDCEFLRQLSEHVALAAHNAQLYSTLQQTYEDLRQSQQTVLEQERLRALGQMASGVAHDINNAISPITLYTESLLEREPNLSERARSYLATIQRAIDDVAQTVSRMREFYRAREPQLTLAQIDVNNIAKQVIDLTRVRWRDVPQERGAVIDLKIELATPVPPIMGAENEIRDALTNLIFNAVDAMPQGGTLTVQSRSIQRGDDADEAVSLEVRDTGVGMSDEVRNRCLEPFFTTKGERGTGLGLAMVYGMVKRHSAELQIDSAPGRGTTMRLLFPSAAATAGVVTQSMLARVALRPLKLLLVDDDPLLIESLQEILQRDGHAVTAANSGQAGIDVFQQACAAAAVFDAVITDLGMPYVDGRRVAAAIKHASPATPVILLTGWGQRLMDDNDIPMHVDRVLNKPPKLEQLRRALAELIPFATRSS